MNALARLDDLLERVPTLDQQVGWLRRGWPEAFAPPTLAERLDPRWLTPHVGLVRGWPKVLSWVRGVQALAPQAPKWPKVKIEQSSWNTAVSTIGNPVPQLVRRGFKK